MFRLITLTLFAILPAIASAQQVHTIERGKADTDQITRVEIACVPHIERLAQYDHEWTDGWTEYKFQSYIERSDGTRVYAGDTLKLQNAFGAWQKVKYVCVYDHDTNTVIDVGAEPGQW